VRCGTNFLILVMLLAVVIYTAGGLLVPPPEGIAWWGAVLYHVVLRIVLLPVVAGGLRGLRLGAAKGDNLLVRAIMKPGLWLQLITTKQPDRRPDRGGDPLLRGGRARRAPRGPGAHHPRQPDHAGRTTACR
jgi:uncharacterized protein YqhQ